MNKKEIIHFLFHFSPKYKKHRIIHCLTFLAIGLILGLYILYIVATIPDFDSLENPDLERLERSSIVYSSDGEILGTYYVESDRLDVSLDEISPYVVQALIAIEDERFYHHSGIDFWGILGAIGDRLRGGSLRGASTITQQLARNFYDEEVGRERSLSRKIKEAVAAIFLERHFSKEEILELYLNTVSFGGTVYGIGSASQYYFHKSPKELNLEEAALLIGLLKGPSYYNPIKHPERAKKRRNVVLSRMKTLGFIAEKEYRRAIKKPIQLKVTSLYAHQQGLAPYFREELRKWLHAWAKKFGYDIYRDGLRIYTTINTVLQREAELAVQKHLKEYQAVFDEHIKGREPWKKHHEIIIDAIRRSDRYKALRKLGWSEERIIDHFKKERIAMSVFDWNAPNRTRDTMMTLWDSVIYHIRFIQTGVVSIEVGTGRILAWVGGPDIRFFNYDHVQLAKRQVGSTFKPFVYAMALLKGAHPCDKVLNEPRTILIKTEDPDSNEYWEPKNADGTFGGYKRLKEGLAHSLNIVTARLVATEDTTTLAARNINFPEQIVPPSELKQLAQQVGITSPIHAVNSIVLGVIEVSPLELASAYTMFANGGVFITPYFIDSIVDKHGKVIYRKHPEKREVLNPTICYTMIDMLRNVVNWGTAASLRWRYKLGYELDICGKTGTTQEHADAWFVGFTPDVVTTVWTGWDDRRIHFYSLWLGQGAKMALPIWAYYYRAIYYENSDSPYNNPVSRKKRFTPPPNYDVILDCEAYDSLKSSTSSHSLPVFYSPNFNQ